MNYVVTSSCIACSDIGGACSTDGSEEGCVQDFGWKTRVKKISWKTLARWENNIKMDLTEIAGDRRLD
jgi:hypothetical protein